MKLSPAMWTVLRALKEHEGEGWTEVLYIFESEHFGGVKNEGSSFHLADKALDKVMVALQRRELVRLEKGLYYLTDAGRTLLAAPKVTP